MNLKNTITYHARAQYHRKKLGSLKEAFYETEKEYLKMYGHNRYCNDKSFRQVHWQIMTGNYRHLK